MNSKMDFMNGKTNGSLIKMFIPLFLAMTLTMVYNMVDSFFVGNMLGKSGMSALTAGTAIVLILNSISMGMGNGVSVMVAQHVGAGDKEKMPGIIASIIAIGAVISLGVFVVAELLIDPILGLMGTPAEIVSDAALYLKLYLIGNAALFVYMIFTSIYRAFGDPTFQMRGMLLTALINVVADPIFIQLMGLAGAAVATLVSEVLCIVYAAFYYKKHQLFVFDFKSMRGEYGKEMLRLSIPTTIQAVMPSLSSAFMISFIASFGINSIAGFGVARNLELIMFMPTTAMTMAVTSIVGQCVGAGRMDRAKDYLKSSMVIGGTMIGIVSLVVILFAGELTGAFGQGEEVAKIVVEFFRIISVGYVLYMLTSCMQGFITGVGKPGMAMVLLIFYYIIIRIPAAIVLKGVLGLTGIWIAFLISHCLSLLIAIAMSVKCCKN